MGAVENMSKYVVQCSWDQVPHLTAAMIADMEASLPPHQRDARMRGIPALGAGAIYPIPESEFVIAPIQLPVHWRRGYAMDVGWNKTAVLFGAYDDDTDTLYFYSEYYRGQAEPSVHADAIKAHGVWLPGVIDPASRGRSQIDGEALFDMYKQLGLNIIAADNAVESGIYEVYQRLSSMRIKVFSNLTNFISEYRLYRRDEKGKIIKDFDHLLDCARYFVTSAMDILAFPPQWMEKTWPKGTNTHQSQYDPFAKDRVMADVGGRVKSENYNPLDRRRF